MKERLVLPPNYQHVEEPIIFLAGPIQGSPDWQTYAGDYIHNLNSLLWVASPRRVSFKLGDSTVFNEQVDWETHYLRQAAKRGVIMFWLAKEQFHSCDRAFAQTTRFELAEWKIRHERDGVILALGIEPGFSNEKYIRRRFNQDCPEISIHPTLEATCRGAVDLVGKI